MKDLKPPASYFIASIILLSAIGLSQYEGVCELPGFNVLFDLRNMWHQKCPHCRLPVTDVSHHEKVCSICNKHWIKCQETHIHCLHCKRVVDTPTSHQKKCELCGVTHFYCQEHTCQVPVGTVPRTPVTNTDR